MSQKQESVVELEQTPRASTDALVPGRKPTSWKSVMYIVVSIVAIAAVVCGLVFGLRVHAASASSNYAAPGLNNNGSSVLSAPPTGSLSFNATKMAVSSDGTCGPSSGACPGSQCCSQYGASLVAYASCLNGAAPAATTTSVVVTKTTSVSAGASPTTIVAGPVSPDNTCGPSNHNYVCGGSQCCSQWGYCGSTSDYCDSCQTGFGACSQPAAPSSGGSQQPAAPSSSLLDPFTPAYPPINFNLLAPVTTQCIAPGMFALTFDDGLMQYTDDLLNILASKNVKASFFINGMNYVDISQGNYPALLKKMYAQGHFIGSHTLNHADLTTLSYQDMWNQMYQNDVVIQKIIGVRPTYMRTPYGAGSVPASPTVQAALASWGYKSLVWLNLDSQDFANNGLSNALQLDQANYQNALGNASPKYNSFITLQHDPLQSTVYEFVPWAIDYVRSMGYRLVTIDECLGINDQYR
ncbi:chitin deacetylase [Kappamyces sp. JEL0680]|nr:chitin deacetylase [Kappamyces sp. JEL0680]